MWPPGLRLSPALWLWQAALNANAEIRRWSFCGSLQDGWKPWPWRALEVIPTVKCRAVIPWALCGFLERRHTTVKPLPVYAELCFSLCPTKLTVMQSGLIQWEVVMTTFTSAFVISLFPHQAPLPILISSCAFSPYQGSNRVKGTHSRTEKIGNIPFLSL